MTVTPLDFAAITGLRVGGDSIPFDTGLTNDDVVLQWFLGFVPRVENGSIIYTSFMRRWNHDPASDEEAEQMARAYLLYLFGASLFLNRHSRYMCPSYRPCGICRRLVFLTGVVAHLRLVTALWELFLEVFLPWELFLEVFLPHPAGTGGSGR